ncbi:MAG: ribbon-helix-helix protein, CopG family [Clostridia bacterium]|nr:ribbon-helix-helix protein, CopG family [Clostridia bacterium]
MAKNLYSLLLDDEVVRALDLLAVRRGMSRSALANAALAEFCAVLTPEERINRIFKSLDAYMGQRPDIVPFLVENRPTMTLKSSLEYKYRPTIRYEVELYRTPDPSGDVGELSVVFRTQSAALVDAITRFFTLWCKLENAYLTPMGRGNITYTVAGGKLTRRLRPAEGLEGEDISKLLGDYITLLDRLMKAYLMGEADAASIEPEYRAALRRGVGLL